MLETHFVVSSKREMASVVPSSCAQIKNAIILLASNCNKLRVPGKFSSGKDREDRDRGPRIMPDFLARVQKIPRGMGE